MMTIRYVFSNLLHKVSSPSELTTLPVQVKAIAQLLVHFNWTWVGLLLSEREYGQFATEGLLRELRRTKVCVAYRKIIPLVYDRPRVQEILQVVYKKHSLEVCFLKVSAVCI